MRFCIVEKKDTDLFTIYDMENGGVCCCSKYTVSQLLDMGHTIYGVQKTARGLGIVEVGLDGKPRQKKAPVICTDTTKRSAVTIAKGLDEKKYPRVKQNRSGIAGEVAPYVPLSIQDNGNSYWGMLTKDYNVVFINRYMTALDTLHPAKNYKNCVVREDMNPQMKDILLQATKTAEEYHDTAAEIALLKKRLNALEQQKQQVGKHYEELSARFDKVKQEVAFDNAVAKAMKQCKGTERVSMKLGSCENKAFIVAVIKKTKRKILYTYGLGYRNPTTYRQPISKEQAIEYVKRGGLLDISSNDEMIHLNEYSGNDMW